MNISVESSRHSLAGLSTSLSGLPFIVWLRRRRAANEIFIEVTRTPHRRNGTVSVIILEPMVMLVQGDLSGEEIELLTRWIGRNHALVEDFWFGTLPDAEVHKHVNKLSVADRSW